MSKLFSMNMAINTLSIKKIIALMGLLSVLLLSGCQQSDPAIAQIKTFISDQGINIEKGDWKGGLIKPPQLNFTEGVSYFWQLKTNKGDIKILLKAKESPMHVSSTIYLTQLGFYNDIIFHRVIPGFMAQGGDPLGVGVGGPGYTYMGEFKSNLSHDKAGTLSMANSGAGTDGSQFFLTFKATPFLDGKHTIFGEVVEGLETLKKLEAVGTRSGKTKEKVVIINASILVE